VIVVDGHRLDLPADLQSDEFPAYVREPMTTGDWIALGALGVLLVAFWCCVVGAIVVSYGFPFVVGAFVCVAGMAGVIEWWSLR
jgi:hypothetical protein